jgi:hypothetical protein
LPKRVATHSTLRPPRSCRLRITHMMRGSSPRLWLPYRVSPMPHRSVLMPCSTRTPSQQRALCPFRGLFPFSVLPTVGSHLTRRDPASSGYVAPSGFLTLSTLCSPHGLPGLFHPGPAHGVSLRGFHPPNGAVCSFERRLPLEVPSDASTPAASSGLSTPQESLPQTWGLTRYLRGCLLGFRPLQGFLLLAVVRMPFGRTSHPLSRFSNAVAR